MPAGVKVLGCSVCSVKDAPEYGKYPDYARHPYTIGPKVLSDKYAMVRVRVTGKVAGRP
ncbi:hypothetical protein [Streptomyces sp. NBC_00989]|uniref:hypothetical protein n=1 Tax=Streptomyces sp. NBC_00989 TaxID=2903705 RepID=UPI0038693C5C|nr:hypothetical protein OG714_26375 [Streptomyces sp. NBC_00989]